MKDEVSTTIKRIKMDQNRIALLKPSFSLRKVMGRAGQIKERINLEILKNFGLLSIKILFAAKDFKVQIINTIKSFEISSGINRHLNLNELRASFIKGAKSERGDVPGWVLVVLMTTGLVTGIWTVAQPRLSSILKNSLDNMNSIR